MASCAVCGITEADHDTASGRWYQRHRTIEGHTDGVCAPSRACQRAYALALRRRLGTGPRQLAGCGTHAGFRRHQQRGEPPCTACHVAYLDYQRRYRREVQGKAERATAQCGTHSGYNAHRSRGEAACDACKTAHAAYNRSAGRQASRRSAPAIAARDGGWLCAYCGANVADEYHVDHIWPVSRAATYPGGDVHELANLVLACPTCNLSKHARTPSEWQQALAGAA